MTRTIKKHKNRQRPFTCFLRSMFASFWGSRFPLRFFEVKNSTSSPHIQLQQKEHPPPPKTLTAHEIKKMEDSLRVEAKDLVEQIKNHRNKLKTDGDDAEFILQIPGQTTPPQLFGEPKRRRLLKGHFGKVSQQPDTTQGQFLPRSGTCEASPR
jgi:hypothetical protein